MPGLFCAAIELEPKAVGQPGQVVEDSNDVSDLKKGLIVEAKCPEPVPVRLDHPRGSGTQLLSNLTKRPVSRAQLQVAPASLLDRLNELRLPMLNTQELCVRLRSVVAVLGGRRHGRDHLALPPIEMPRAEHYLAI